MVISFAYFARQLQPRRIGQLKVDDDHVERFFIEELTELVEEAVLTEFLKINERGGVLGAMETQYQRSRIQEESLHYERLKHTGELAIIGVNTFIDPKTLVSGYVPPRIEMARATQEEKLCQLNQVSAIHKKNEQQAPENLRRLQAAVLNGENVFECLMEVSRYCTLGEISKALYSVGGQYRRSV